MCKATTSSSLITLPNEVILLIASFLPPESLSTTIQTSTHLAALLEPTLYREIAENVGDGPYDRLVFIQSAAKKYHPFFFIKYHQHTTHTRFALDLTGKTEVLCEAAEQGHLATVEYFLDLGAEINTLVELFPPNSFCYARTALEAAATRGHLEVARLVLDCGADPEISIGTTNNALGTAAEGGYKDVVELLLDRGADLSQAYGTLCSARRSGNTELIGFLIERGAQT